MECKYSLGIIALFQQKELIETLWNVNASGGSGRVNKRVLELIETLWNVNESYACHQRPCVLELIETLWNVNTRYCQM